MKSKFWCVWSESRGRIPTFKHRTPGSARTEAERLARLHPGDEFAVLASVESVQVAGVRWEDHASRVDEHGNELPF